MGQAAWRPTATLATLRMRAQLLAATRAFFSERGVLEVETPAMSPAGVSDPQLEQVSARVRSLGTQPLYLATSPEHAMKRLLAAGSGDIYQICRVFRDDELGRWHQPEFTLLEWYRLGWDESRLMGEVDSLLTTLLAPHRAMGSTLRLSYREAFQGQLQIDPLDPGGIEALRERLPGRGIEVPETMGDDELLNLALGAAVAPGLDPRRITFVYDFPASQAALARLKPGPPPVAARFEAFCAGLELANGFDELTDEREQRARFQAERDRRERIGRPTPPLDEELLAALAHGLPRCAGVAIGLDRVIALAAGASALSEAVSFAHAKPSP